MAKYVVIVHDDYQNRHTAKPVFVEAHGKPGAIKIAMETASHAWNIGITHVEVHLVYNDDWYKE